MTDSQKPKKSGRGGKREGAGRKPNGVYTYKLPAAFTKEQEAHIRAKAPVLDMGYAEFLRHLVDLDRKAAAAGLDLVSLVESAINAQNPDT